MIYNVLPFDELKARQAEFDVIVTVLEGYNRPMYQLDNIPGQVVIREWFSDVSSPNFPGAPRRKQIETILSAAKWLKGDLKVGVACAMGISRSSATCLALLAQEEGDPVKAWSRLMQDPRHDQFRPNELVVSLADDILKMHGKLLAIVKPYNMTAWDMTRELYPVDDHQNGVYLRHYFAPERTPLNWRDKFTYKQLTFDAWLKQVNGRLSSVRQVPAHDWKMDYEAGLTPRESVEEALSE